MTPLILFYIILIIITVGYITDTWLGLLNNKHRNRKLPEELKDIYEPDKYLRSQQYGYTSFRFSLLSDGFSYVLLMAVLLLGGFAFLDETIRLYTSHPVIIALLFFGTIGFISDLLSTPFTAYATFVIEQTYGFNKTTVRTFILDKLKGWLLSLIIGIPLMAFIVWLFDIGGPHIWLYAWLAVTAFTLFFTFFYSSLIVPLFNKQTPLPDGELRTAIEAYAAQTGFRISNIFVIDGSKRSAKANAYFTGFGSRKRIVLYDTLINELNTDELVAVLAHETGHYKKKHILKSIIASVVETGFMFFLLGQFVKSPMLSEAIGITEPSFHAGAITFGLLYGVFTTFTGIVTNMVSRHNEYEADHYAAQTWKAEALISGLKKLTAHNLSNLTPHPLYVFVNYSHPTLYERVMRMRGGGVS